tara:strand:- start:424 stop:624 length:201 start_codon:yes stop_codon:yes gene_type:complete
LVVAVEEDLEIMPFQQTTLVNLDLVHLPRQEILDQVAVVDKEIVHLQMVKEQEVHLVILVVVEHLI